MRIVNTCKYAHLPDEHPAVQRVLAKAEFVTCEKAKLTSEELLEFVQGADALISGTDFIRADLIEKFPKSPKVISTATRGFPQARGSHRRSISRKGKPRGLRCPAPALDAASAPGNAPSPPSRCGTAGRYG